MSALSPASLPPAAFRSLIGIAGNAFAAPCPRPLLHCPPTVDAGQCRIWLNDARLEIDRLRRGMDRVDLCSGQVVRQVHGTPASRDRDRDPSMTTGLTSYRRRAYAVAAIGDVSMMQPSTLPRTLAQPVISVPMITNLGSMMDVLL